METVVYVVSNDLTKGQQFAEIFRHQAIAVVSFGSAAAYIAAKRSDQMACLIADMQLCDLGGLEFQRRLSEIGGPPVIFLAGQSDPASCVRAVKNGAIDVLSEPLDPKELMASVEVAFMRDQRIRREKRERVSLLTRWRTLTPRETEVLHHTVAGLLNKQAAAELGVAENTYQVHRGRVMRKMEADSLAQLVRMSIKLEASLRHTSPNRPLVREAKMRAVAPPLPKSVQTPAVYAPRSTSDYGRIPAYARL